MKTFAFWVRGFGEASYASVSLEARSRTEACRLLRAIDCVPGFQPVGSFAAFERRLMEV